MSKRTAAAYCSSSTKTLGRVDKSGNGMHKVRRTICVMLGVVAVALPLAVLGLVPSAGMAGGIVLGFLFPRVLMLGSVFAVLGVLLAVPSSADRQYWRRNSAPLIFCMTVAVVELAGVVWLLPQMMW